MGITVGVLRALVDLSCFNLYHSEFLCFDLFFFFFFFLILNLKTRFASYIP